MLALCYHNGALGHTVSALLDCCTKEGNKNFPSFDKGKHLHHHKPRSNFYYIKHPIINITRERKLGNKIISSSSFSTAGRMLILLMGMIKTEGRCPEFNSPLFYNQGVGSFGEQIEVLSYTLLNKVCDDASWNLEVDYVLDILNFWYDPESVIKFLQDCDLTPDNSKVFEFCKLVSENNQEYFDTIQKCLKIRDDVINNYVCDIKLNFFETAMCHMLLLEQTSKDYRNILLLKSSPTSTANFIEIFKD